MKRLALLALLLPQAGCFLYFGDDDDQCDAIPPQPGGELRNPQSGQCEYVGGGGGWGCDVPLGAGTDSDAPNAGLAEAPAFYPDWGVCESFCNTLGEGDCLVADACRAIYVDVCAGTMNDCAIVQFAACWATPPTGPIRGGGCSGLDSQTCSLHDDCSAVHFNQFCPPDALCALTPAEYMYCQDEPDAGGCFSDEECPAGFECTSDTECLNPPGCDPATGQLCPPVCYGRCVPIGGGGCENVACPDGSHCESVCTPADPACDGGPMGCPETCVVECVPDMILPASCGGLDEATCIDMIDGCVTSSNGTTACADIACEPIYEGSDCTCDPMGCHCNVQTYVACNDSVP